MTDNTQGLDEILGNLFHQGWGWHKATLHPQNRFDELEKRDESVEMAKQAILNWHNKQVEGVLYRLTAQEWSFGEGDDAMAVPTRYIKAERNKLKEKTND